MLIDDVPEWDDPNVLYRQLLEVYGSTLASMAGLYATTDSLMIWDPWRFHHGPISPIEAIDLIHHPVHPCTLRAIFERLGYPSDRGRKANDIRAGRPVLRRG